jgi:hypothetical protein
MEEFNFDNSLLEDFASCEAKGIVKHALGRMSRNKKYAADLGNAGHKAMKVYFSGQGKDAAMRVFGVEYDKVIPPGEMPNSDKAEMMERGNLTTIMEQYFDTMPLGRFPFEVIETEKVKGVEIGDGLKLWYTRDMLVRERVTGEILPLDHKFRFGTITSWWTGKFKNGSQFTCYLWCTEQETGSPTSKQYVNAVSFNKLPDSPKKCRVHKVPFAECRKEHCDFQLLTYSRTSEQLAKWRREVEVKAKQARVLIRGFGKKELLPFAPRTGTFNGGCVFCEFQEWCRNGFDPAMMEEYTVEGWWRPWEKGDGGELEGLSETPSGVKWFYRQVNDEVKPALDKPGENWLEITEAMGLKSLWHKGREVWMRVWKECPQAQEAMAKWAREQQGG